MVETEIEACWQTRVVPLQPVTSPRVVRCGLATVVQQQLLLAQGRRDRLEPTAATLDRDVAIFIDSYKQYPNLHLTPAFFSGTREFYSTELTIKAEEARITHGGVDGSASYQAALKAWSKAVFPHHAIEVDGAPTRDLAGSL